MTQRKNILICPLDWGLGHATRCVPVIREFIAQNANVIIAASDRPLAFLQKEFPGLTFLEFPGYDITYPKNGGMAAAMLRSAPSILNAIRKEKKLLNKIITDHKIDIVISDNRFGVHSKEAYSIYMTHQVMIKCPPALSSFEYVLHRKHKSYIAHYDECWIPDFQEEPNFSGELAHKYKAHNNTFFIGPLSRFIPVTENRTHEKVYDAAVILSGPEPQRSIFERIVMEQALAMKDKNFIFISGKTDEEFDSNKNSRIRTVAHLETEEMRNTILGSDVVISRPGYSSIMDLAMLGKKAVFVPTPGQTEQEYLARYYSEKKIFFSMRQKEFSLQLCFSNYKGFQGLQVKPDNGTLKLRIHHLLTK